MPSISAIADKAKLSVSCNKMLFTLLVVGMTLFGFVMIYSASAPSAVSEGSSPFVYLLDQLKFALLGGIGAFLAYIIDYRFWTTKWVNLIWGACLFLVLLTIPMGAGSESWGAQRWLVIGPISMQPSEFMKVALVLVGAKVMVKWHEGEYDNRTAMVNAFVLVVMPAAIIFTTQSDLGTTMIIAAGILSVLWLGEIPLRIILGIIAVVIAFALFATVFSSYRSNRFLYLNPWDDGKNGYGAGYQIIQSFYAFSQGGLLGTGIGNSTQKYLYLPESETDFIFSVIGEELGMVGALIIIALFIVLLYAGLEIARNADDEYGTMVAGALSIMIVFQAFLNMGSAMGVFPTTGKPLPFISSGGSSLIATFLMVGLILSVARVAEGPDARRGRKRGDIYEQRRDDLRVVRMADAADMGKGSDRSAGFSGVGRVSDGAFGRSARSCDLNYTDSGGRGGRTSSRSAVRAGRGESPRGRRI